MVVGRICFGFWFVCWDGSPTKKRRGHNSTGHCWILSLIQKFCSFFDTNYTKCKHWDLRRKLLQHQGNASMLHVGKVLKRNNKNQLSKKTSLQLWLLQCTQVPFLPHPFTGLNSILWYLRGRHTEWIHINGCHDAMMASPKSDKNKTTNHCFFLVCNNQRLRTNPRYLCHETINCHPSRKRIKTRGEGLYPTPAPVCSGSAGMDFSLFKKWAVDQSHTGFPIISSWKILVGF